MTISIKSAESTWTEAEDAFINVGGTWKVAKAAWANLSGTWQQTHVLKVLDRAYRFNGGLGFNNSILAIAVDSTGKVVIGGNFTTLNNLTRNRLVRLNANGTEDVAFNNAFATGANPGLNGSANSIEIQSDGKIIIAGGFTTLNGLTRNRLIRLNSDGTEDTSFYTNLGTAFNSTLYAVKVQSDGKILVGGAFTTINGTSLTGLVRLNSSGTRDTSFSGSNVGTSVLSIAIQSDLKILVAGSFTTFQGLTRNRLIRLNQNGTEDTAFYANVGAVNGFDGAINSVAVQSSGNILVGGNFTFLNSQYRPRFAVLSSTGLDVTPASFYDNFGFNGEIFAIAIQSDDKVLIGGQFNDVNKATRNRLIRLNADGTFDSAFYANLGSAFDDAVYSIAVRSDGNIFVGGNFTLLNGVYRPRFAVLSPTGADITPSIFYANYGFNSNIFQSAVQSDGKIIIGGSFTELNFTVRNRILRLNADGTEDTSFTTNIGTGFSSQISSIKIQSDGKILIGGYFLTFKGFTRRYLVRLNSDGTEDTAFYTNLANAFNNSVETLAIQSDGKILVAGQFTTLNGATRNRLVRLNSDGTEDTGFYTNLGTAFNNIVYSLAVQSNGQILVGGQFTTLNGTTRNRLVRLNSDGTVDTTFYTNLGTNAVSGTVNAITIQADGKILIGGSFTAVGPSTRNRLNRLNSDGTTDTAFYTNLGTAFGSTVNAITVQSDGKILVGGAFTTLNGATRNYLVRLNSTGSEDSAFYTNLGNGFDGIVNSISVQSNGKIIVTGQFLSLNSVPVLRLVELESTGARSFIAINTLRAFNSTVWSISIQSDNKVIIGGSFTTFNAVPRNRLVRLNSDFTEDTSFSANLGTGFPGGIVFSISLQTDGKILIGGSFTTFNGVTRNYLIRLNSDGSQDTAFYTNIGTGFNSQVNSVKLQSDGKILVGGTFTTLNGSTRNRLVRLNSDGTLDSAFSANIGAGFDNSVTSIAVLSTGKIIVGGEFILYNSTKSRNRIVALNSDGTEDASFYGNLGTAFNGRSSILVPDASDRIIIGGSFQFLNSVIKNYLVRLNPDGTDSFIAITNHKAFGSIVNAILIQSDDKIIVAGGYNNYNGFLRNYLVRLNSDLTEDSAFYGNMGTAFSSTVLSAAIGPDGKIFTGGSFSLFNSKVRFYFTALNSNGSEYLTDIVNFKGINSNTNSAFIQPDNKIVLGGQFTTFNDLTRNRLIRLNENGTEDTSFYANLGTGFDAVVNAIGLQSDGKIVVAGNFTTVNGISRSRLVRLNSDGTEDTAFGTALGTGFNGAILTLAIQSDGKILVGGQFTTFNGVARNRILRLNSNGTVDTAFSSNVGSGGAASDVRAIVIQQDGKIIIGGAFTSFGGGTRNRIVRLNSDGTYDAAFNAATGTAANNTVFGIAVQPDGKIVVVGQFTTFNAITRNYIVRLNSDGTADTAFYTSLGTAFNTITYGVAVDQNSKIIVVGNFTTLNGVTKNRIVRLNQDGTEDVAFYQSLINGFNSLANSVKVEFNGKILVTGSQPGIANYITPYFTIIKAI